MDPDGSILIQALVLLILIGINAFFAASEIAIISLSNQKIKKMAEEGHKKAILLQNLVNEPSRFLATIQVGVTLAGLMASAVAAESFADNLTNYVKTLGLPFQASVINIFSVVIITIFLAYFTLVLGELVPKRLAMQKPEQISMFSVKPLHFISKVTSPFVRFLSFSTNTMIRLLGGNPAYSEEKITEEEIRMMVDVGQEKGIIRSAEKEMINNIFEFDNKTVAEIMTHRIDVIALSIDSSLSEVMETVVAEKFSRIPIYDKTIDDIIGVLHIQDLMPFLKNSNRNGFSLKKIIKEPYFVHVSKKTDELLKELQRHKTHMAVVIDEYGGTAGIVTVEDLLEEIVGNIFDEHDEVEHDVLKVDENTFIVDGTLNLNRLGELLEINDLPTDDYETVSGFIIGLLGRIPKDDERPVIEYDDLVLKVEDVEEKRVSKVKICKSLKC